MLPKEQHDELFRWWVRRVSFDAWLAQFKARYATLTPDQQLQVDRAMGDVEAIERTVVRDNASSRG